MSLSVVSRPFLRLLKYSERHLKTDVVYLVRSGFWSNMGTLTVTVGSLLLYIVFSRYLTKETYGMYQYLLSIGAIIGAFTLTGMNAAVTRAVARGYDGSLRQSIRVQLIWNVIPTICAWLIGGYYLLAGNSTLGWGLVLIGIFVPLNNTLNTYGAFLGGKKDFRRGFLFSLWWNVPYYALVAIMAIYWKAALVLLTANLISQFLGLIIAYRSTLAAYTPSSEKDPEILRYGGHLSAMGLFSSIVNQADTILVFQVLGPVQLALYSFATAVPDRIGALFKFIPSAALPKFAESTPTKIRAGFARRLAIGTFAALCVALAYLGVAHLIFAVLFPTYLAAVPYSLLYAFSLATLMSGVVVNALTAAGNMRSLYVYNLAAPIIMLTLQVAGILLFGLWGLVGARVAAQLILLLLACVLYWRID